MKTTKTHKAQASVEYMLLVGLLFVIMIPLFYYAAHESTDRIRLNQAEDAVKSVSRTAENMHSLGPGSKDTIWVTIPSGVTGQFVNDSEIGLAIDFAGSSSEVVEFVKAKVTGTLPTDSGTYRILVQMLDSGVVQIGEYNDVEAPVVVFTSPNGIINYNAITLLANTNEPAFCNYDTDDSSYSDMAGNFTGILLNHQKYLGLFPDGNYIYYIRCMDYSGNTMQLSAIANFTIIYQPDNESNLTYEPNPPNVTIIAPPNSYFDSDGVVEFRFNVSDQSYVPVCNLFFNDSVQAFFSNISLLQPNIRTVTGLDYGSYYWKISCIDAHGNIGNSTPQTIIINYTQDNDIPIINLEGPADGLVRNYWLMKFAYNVSDVTSDIDYCSLNLNGVTDTNGTLLWSVVDTPIVEGVSQTITIPLLKANYLWNISCVDQSQRQNVGVSETRTLIINVTAGEEAFINSCAGWCGWQGLSSGLCENTENKCANNCDLPYSTSHDCYAGAAVSVEYCTGGAEADTCCCTF